MPKSRFLTTRKSVRFRKHVIRRREPKIGGLVAKLSHEEIEALIAAGARAESEKEEIK